MPEQPEWPTWTTGRIVGACAMILAGLVMGFVGLVITAVLFYDSYIDLPVAIRLLLSGAMLGGFPAGLGFFVLSRFRGKPLWSWLGALVWLIFGALVFVAQPTALNRIEKMVLLVGLTVVAAALGWIAEWTLRRATTRPRNDIGPEP